MSRHFNQFLNLLKCFVPAWGVGTSVPTKMIAGLGVKTAEASRAETRNQTQTDELT